MAIAMHRMVGHFEILRFALKTLSGAVFLLAVAVWAQSDNTCTVLKWEDKTYSQSAHITRNHPVYSVSVGNVIYQIGRRTTAVEMQTGQQVKCRVESGHMLVLNEKKKETKYDILGSEPVSK